MIKTYFDKQELLSKHVYNIGGGYELLHPDLQNLVVWIREKLGRPMFANNWAIGGQFSQRGYRTNDDPVCKTQKFVPGSAHFKGMALDFDVKGMTAEQVRKWLYENQEDAPVRFRVEKGVNWVHVDVMPHKASDKAYFFNP